MHCHDMGGEKPAESFRIRKVEFRCGKIMCCGKFRNVDLCFCGRKFTVIVEINGCRITMIYGRRSFCSAVEFRMKYCAVDLMNGLIFEFFHD